MCTEEGCGAECPALEQPPPLLGFSIPARAGPRGASMLCLPAGIWHVSAEAFGAAPEPPPPTRASRSAPGAGPPVRPPPLCPPADAGRSSKASPWSCRRLPGAQVSATGSGAHPVWRGAAPRVYGRGGASTQNPGCLRRDPPRTCPPRCPP